MGGEPVIPLSLARIARVTGGQLGHGDPDAVVSGEVVIDSRRAGPGGLFAAVAGERSDGHDFAAAAVAAGATAVLATRPVTVPSVLVADVPAALAALARSVVDALPAVRIAGITGSSGKTSTKDLAAQLVERLGPTIAPAAWFNNEFALPLTVLRADAATRYLVLELSARGIGHIAYLCRVAPPRYGVVLNVGHAHAGEFGGLDQVARAKGELVEALPADGVAILNADDPRVLAMAERAVARVVTFSASPHARTPQPSVEAADIRLDELGRPSFTLLTPEGSAPVSLRLHGAHNVPNALAAAALAGELGLDLDSIADGLGAAVARSRWRMGQGRPGGGPGRGRRCPGGGGRLVKAVLLAAAVSMFIALFGTPLAIKTFSRRGYGQEIRSDGPAGHLSKRGTPTMGGTVIIVASLTGYLIGHVVTGSAMSASGLLVLFLMTGLRLVGFADDFIKLYMQRSLGLRSGAKLAGQAVVGGVFALLAIRFPDGYALTPASTHLSFYADFGISIGPVLFVVWVIFMVAGTSNGVNLTDGLDGLATGAAILVLAAYMIIGIWQLRNDCTVFLAPACYAVRDPQDLAIVAATVMGACAGFLWWNAPPAKIFMGDTGSLALGGALAGLAITTKTELLLLLLGGLFVIITLSVVIQVGSFKLTGKRVFRMAPLQHHFELAGWAETTIVVRFWIIAGICVALGLGIFYVG